MSWGWRLPKRGRVLQCRNHRGQTVIDLKQQKTGNHVVIPARPEFLAILAKYDNRLPKSYEQKVH